MINEVFYRSCHVLSWIDKHQKMSEIDKQAISATIMDALVYKGLIKPEEEFLNLDELCITDNVNDYHYEKHPFVCSIPQCLKEEFRSKALVITAGILVSIFLSKPPSDVLRYCVFDPNIAVSSFFDNFSFLIADYDSPTRSGVRAVDRPFVEVKIDGVLYLVDILTKRIFRTDKFSELFNLKVKKCSSKNDFSKEKTKFYNEQTEKKLDLAIYLALNLPIVETLKNVDEFAEMNYEIEKSKEYFSEEWEKAEEIKKQMAVLTL